MLKQQIQADTTTALKQGDANVIQVLRMALASVISKEKERRYKISKDRPDLAEDVLTKESELSDELVLEVIINEVKKRRDAIALYEQGKRPELAEKEKKEIEILQRYLPTQLSEEELRKIIQESITKTGAKEVKDTGKIMADLMPKVKGRADNVQISKIIKEFLSN